MSPRLPSLPPNLPGMMALGAYRPDVYAQMAALANTSLRNGHPESTLVPNEREMIASYVSSLNECTYCATVHGAVAAAHLCTAKSDTSRPIHPINKAAADKIVDSVCIKRDNETSGVEVSLKLKQLLQIAAQVRESGLNITPEAIAKARENGATNMDIHDTVLIASLFCMFNRYVDGLTGDVLGSVEQLKAGGQMIAERGYAARKDSATSDS